MVFLIDAWVVRGRCGGTQKERYESCYVLVESLATRIICAQQNDGGEQEGQRTPM